jgi:hypothetical protein
MSAESFSDLATQLDATAGLFVSHVSEASTNPKLDRCTTCWERWPCDAADARDALRRAADALRLAERLIDIHLDQVEEATMELADVKAELAAAAPVVDAADAWITAVVGFTGGDTSWRALNDAKSTLARAARARRSPTPPPPEAS